MSWVTTKLGDVLTLKRGYDLPSSIRELGDVPVVSSSGMTGQHNVAKVNGPGVVTGRYGTLGEVFFVDKDFWPLNTSLYVQNFKGNIPRFIAYFLRQVLGRLSSNKAAVPGVNRNDLHEMTVQLPDPKTQERIAHTLAAYDDLIENNRRRIQLLEAAARRLYQEWFIRLRFPGHEHVMIKDGVPEGWLRGKVGDVAEVRSGFAFKSRDWKSEGNPVIKIKNIVGDGTIDINSCDCVDDFIVNEASKFIIEPGSLLIAMTGATIGKVGLMPITLNNYYLNQRVGKFRTRSIEKIEYFLYQFFFMNGFAHTQVKNNASGAAQPNISGSQVESIELLIPQLALLTIFLDSVVEGFQMRQNLIEQNEKLKKARDLLLPRLMNGEIAV